MHKNLLFICGVIIFYLIQISPLCQSISAMEIMGHSSCTIIVESNPSSSTVFLDSVNIGKTPLIVSINNIKNHQLVIRNTGYIPFKCEIGTESQDTISIKATLERYSGAIAVFSNNDESIIKINGKEYGKGRIDSLDLEMGIYKLSLFNPFYQREVSTEIKIDNLKLTTYEAEYDIISIPKLLGNLILPGSAQLNDNKYYKGTGFTFAALGSVTFMISKYITYANAEDSYKTALHNYDFANDESSVLSARYEADRKQKEYQTSKNNFRISVGIVAIVWVVNAIDVGINHLFTDRINILSCTNPLEGQHFLASNYSISLKYRID